MMKLAVYLITVAGGLALIIRRILASPLYDWMTNGKPVGPHRCNDSTTSAYDRSIKEASRERDP